MNRYKGTLKWIPLFIVPILLVLCSTPDFNSLDIDGIGDTTATPGAPTITISGDNPDTIIVGDSWTNPDVSANDTLDGDISSSILSSGSVDTSKAGTYKIVYTVTNSSNLSATETLTVVVENPPKDTIPPVIKIEGSNPITINKGDAFVKPTVTATDETDGDITSKIDSSGFVNTGNPGTYKLFFEVEDAAGNKDYDTLVVKVIDPSSTDSVPPVITITPDKPDTVHLYGQISAEVTAVDDVDGDVTDNLVNIGDTFENDVLGTQLIIYEVTDNAGNSATDTLIVVVIDTIKPVINIPGDNPINLEKGDVFSEPVVTATDDPDGNLTSEIKKTGAINTANPGTQKLYYEVSDASGNKDYDTLVVIITDPSSNDSVPPVITITPDKPDTINIGESIKAVVTASDDIDGDITNSIVVSGNFDNSKGGVCNQIYTVKDGAGHEAKDTLIVVVIDNVKPVIAIPGSNPLKISVNGTYTQPDVTATDETDGDLTSSIVVGGDEVKTATAGTYKVSFTVEDAAKNVDSDTLTVIVEADEVAPELYFNNEQYDTVQLYLDESASAIEDPAPIATDNVDGDISANIQDSGTINFGATGTYKKYFYVSDAAGNTTQIEQLIIIANPTIVDDFEAGYPGQIGILGINESDGWWYAYKAENTTMEPGLDTVIDEKVGTKGAKNGTNGLYSKISLKGTNYPYGTMAFDFRNENTYINLSKMTSFEFNLKGTKAGLATAKVLINFTNKLVKDTLAAESGWWGAIEADITDSITADWKSVKLTPENIKASKWSDIETAKINWDSVKDKVSGIEISVSAGDAKVDTTSVIELYIDDIKINY